MESFVPWRDEAAVGSKGEEEHSALRGQLWEVSEGVQGQLAPPSLAHLASDLMKFDLAE